MSHAIGSKGSSVTALPVPQTFVEQPGKQLELAGWVALTVSFWAAAFPAITVALKDFSPQQLAVIRFGLTGLIMVPLAFRRKIRLPAWEDLPRLMLAGFLGVAGYHVALNTGQKTVSPGAASLIVNTAPLLTTIFATFMLGEKFRLRTFAGLLLGLGGVAVISFGENKGFGLNRGALFVLLAALFQSLYFMVQKPLLRKFTPFEVVAYSVWFGTVCLLPFSSNLSGAVVNSSSTGMISLLYLAVFPGLLSFIAWSQVLARLPASRASTFLYLIPVIAIFVSWIWLGQVPHAFTIVGGALALAGVILANSGKRISN